MKKNIFCNKAFKKQGHTLNNKHSISSLYTNNSNNTLIKDDGKSMSLFNFFHVQNQGLNTITQKHTKPRSNAVQHINKYKDGTLTKKFPLISNKPKINKNITKIIKPYIDNTKYYFISENELHQLIPVFNTLVINNLIPLYSTNIDIDNDNIFFNYINNNPSKYFNDENISYIILKYILYTYNNLIFIPDIYLQDPVKDKNTINEYMKLFKLISGLQPNKSLSLPYIPVNIKECEYFYPKLCSIIKNYITTFQYIQKNNYSLYPKNALVLYVPNINYFFELNKVIEIILNYYNYEILQLDQFDYINKSQIFYRASEATKSERLLSVKEDMKKQIDIIQSLAEDIKWKKFIDNSGKYMPKEEDVVVNSNYNNDNIDNDTATVSVNNTNIKISFDSNDNDKQELSACSSICSRSSFNMFIFQESDINNDTNNEIKVLQNLKHNIYSILSKKKTVILIIDTFQQEEIDRVYLSNILNKISTSKCPTIILTTNINAFDICNIYNLLSLDIQIYEPEYDILNNKENVVYIISMAFILHFILLKNDNILEYSQILNYIKTDYLNNNDFLNIVKNNDIYAKIIKISEYICIQNDFNLEASLIYINNLKFNIGNICYNPFTNIINNDVIDLIDKLIYNKKQNKSNLKDLDYILEKSSFEDYEDTQIQNIINKEYKNKVNNIPNLSEVKEYNSKDNFILINLEGLLYKTTYDNNKSNDISYYLTKDNQNKDIYEYKSFLKLYYNHSYIIDNNSYLDMNIIFKLLFDTHFNFDKFLEVMQYKRLRSLKKVKNEFEKRFHILCNCFSDCSLTQFKRYINALNYNNKFIYYCNEVYYNRLVGNNFFSNYNIYEKIKNIQNIEWSKRKVNSRLDEYDDLTDEFDKL